jgi:hypothetical protein
MDGHSIENMTFVIEAEVGTNSPNDGSNGVIASIEQFIDAWNERCHPFTWPKPPTRCSPEPGARQRISDARH